MKDNHEIICFVDNNPVLSDTSLFGISIISADRILGYQEEDIVICTEAYNQIGKQLKEKGILNYYIMLDGHLYKSSEQKVKSGHVQDAL